MSDIFLSYAREDLDKAKQLAAALEKQGWSVFWDRTSLLAGQDFEEVIELAIEQADCMIVVWSAASKRSDWVRGEANIGRGRKILVPVLFEAIEPPIAFRSLHTENFAAWNGDLNSDEFNKLQLAVTRLIDPGTSSDQIRPANKNSSTFASSPNQQSKSIVWLHLSDLHLCEPKSGWDAHRVLEPLLKDLQHMEKEHGLLPQLIFFTGDAAFGSYGSGLGSTLSEQYQGIETFLSEVRSVFTVEIPKANLFLVPGNHDVDRKKATKPLTTWIEQQNDESIITDLIMQGDETWKQFIERLTLYRQFLQDHDYTHLLGDPERLIYNQVRVVNGVKIGIGGFNSAWSCGRDGEKGKLWLGGNWQNGTIVNSLKKQKADLKLALIHHPPGWFVEQEDSKMRTQMERDFDFFLHGHEYQGWVNASTDGHVRIAAAACYENSDKDNGYNFVRLNLETGKVEIWLRMFDSDGGGWIPRIISGKTTNDGLWLIDSHPCLLQFKNNISHQIACPETPLISTVVSNKTYIEPDMVVIPTRGFLMGSDRSSFEQPMHTACIAKPYSIAKYLVTFEEYQLFVKSKNGKPPNDQGFGRGKRPVIDVSWEDATAYASWLSAVSGKSYRLPSEAEWEYAARAGSKSAYYWGDSENNIDSFAWFKGNSVGKIHAVGDEERYRKTQAVGELKPNDFGIFDMSGNVSEWVEDCWHDNYQNAPTDGSSWHAQNDGESFFRVVRGGSWIDTPPWLRSASRNRYRPYYRSDFIGFRLAQD